MAVSVWIRGVVVLALLASVGLLCVQYGAAADHVEYPPEDELRTNYEQHVGERTYHWLTVLEVRHDELVVGSEDGLRLTVPVRDAAASPGDVVQVYGTLRPNHVVEPDRVVVSDQRGRQVMYAVSSVAVLLAAVSFFRSWTFDRRRGVFEPGGDDA